MVFYESPRRLARTLRELADSLGPRPTVIARELTKLHEEFIRGNLETLAERLADVTLRGEITVLIEGAILAIEVWSQATLEAEVRTRLGRGNGARDIARELATQSGHRRREVYDNGHPSAR